MFPSNQAPESPKFSIHRSLLVARESPLPRPPGYSARYSPSCPESSLAGRSAGYPVRNPESYLVCYSVNCGASYLEMNSASCSESCGDRCSASCSAGCPASCSGSSPQSSLSSSGAGSPLSYSESYPASCSVSCLESLSAGSLPRHHDLADRSHVPRPSSLAPDEIHPRRQRPHVIRARPQV